MRGQAEVEADDLGADVVHEGKRLHARLGERQCVLIAKRVLELHANGVVVLDNQKFWLCRVHRTVSQRFAARPTSRAVASACHSGSVTLNVVPVPSVLST